MSDFEQTEIPLAEPPPTDLQPTELEDTELQPNELHQAELQEFEGNYTSCIRKREVDATEFERLQLCLHAQAHPKATQHELSTWFSTKFKKQINQSTVSRMLKRFREDVAPPEIVDLTSKSTIKRTRRVQYPELDTVLYEWFLCFERQVPMSGELIKQKAAIVFKALYPNEEKSLKFSNGWLEACKERNKIKEFKKHGESGDVDMRVVENNLPVLRNTLGVFRQNDIYNMDETAFFYQLIPDRSLATQLWEGGKQSKHRMTVVVYTNSLSTDKIPL